MCASAGCCCLLILAQRPHRLLAEPAGALRGPVGFGEGSFSGVSPVFWDPRLRRVVDLVHRCGRLGCWGLFFLPQPLKHEIYTPLILNNEI